MWRVGAGVCTRRTGHCDPSQRYQPITAELLRQISAKNEFNGRGGGREREMEREMERERETKSETERLISGGIGVGTRWERWDSSPPLLETVAFFPP